MPKLTIDGKEIEVKSGTMIMQACDQLKIGLPRYCYHPGLSIAGNCRICLVDVEKAPKPAIACKTECADGMVVHTDTPAVKQLQAHVLEFLLINHPLDCPVCDQAGECKLQDYYMTYGLYDPKFNENKVKKTRKAFPIGPTIMLDQERCILCSRCVRFTDEITKTHEFGIVNRGDHSEITVSKELDNPYAGNVADICPVGALTDRDFRFKMRVWYLRSADSVCPGCSRGCNIEVHYNDRPKLKHHGEGKRVMRIKPRENSWVNRWWICDEGRYGYKFVDDNRITQLRGAEDWPSAIRLVADQLKRLSSKSRTAVAVLLSPRQSNEELYVAKRLFEQALDPSQLYVLAPNKPGREDEFLMRADKNPNTKGAELLGLSAQGDVFKRLLDDAAAGRLTSLYVFGQDLVALYGEEAKRLIKQLAFVVFQGTNRNETAPLASVVLPSAVYAEHEGTFTNCDGRVQRFKRAFPPLEGVWEGRAILEALGQSLGFEVPRGTADEVYKRLVEKYPAFRSPEPHVPAAAVLTGAAT